MIEKQKTMDEGEARVASAVRLLSFRLGDKFETLKEKKRSFLTSTFIILISKIAKTRIGQQTIQLYESSPAFKDTNRMIKNCDTDLVFREPALIVKNGI